MSRKLPLRSFSRSRGEHRRSIRGRYGTARACHAVASRSTLAGRWATAPGLGVQHIEEPYLGGKIEEPY